MLFLLYSVVHLLILSYAYFSLDIHFSPESVVLTLLSLRLVYDNFIIFLTPIFIRRNLGRVRLLNKVRFWLHELLTPFLLPVLFRFGQKNFGFSSFSVLGTDILAVKFLVLGIKFGRELRLNPIQRDGRFCHWKSSHSGRVKALLLVPIILAVLVSIYLGFVDYFRNDKILLLFSSVIIFTCASKPDSLVLGNFGEIVYMIGLWWRIMLV